jgi:hypothetical protein
MIAGPHGLSLRWGTQWTRGEFVSDLPGITRLRQPRRTPRDDEIRPPIAQPGSHFWRGIFGGESSDGHCVLFSGITSDKGIATIVDAIAIQGRRVGGARSARIYA